MEEFVAPALACFAAWCPTLKSSSADLQIQEQLCLHLGWSWEGGATGQSPAPVLLPKCYHEAL